MAKVNNLRVLAMTVAVVAAVLATVTVAIVDIRDAEAAFPGLNGRIAFDRNDDIWTMDPNGSDQRNLTSGLNAPSSDPTWSPDGTKIAFERYVSTGSTEIFSMNADGTGLTRLTNNATSDRFPAWSPDGTRIVFARFRAGATTENDDWDIWMMDSSGSGQRRLSSTTDWDLVPAWSPDGRKIAFERNRRLYLMNPDGTDPRRLSGTGGIGSFPNWSPDGTRLVFTRDRLGGEVSDEVAVINANGTGETRLTNDTTVEVAPAFSPDGRYIVFSGCAPYEPGLPSACSVRKMRLNDTFQTDLTSPPAEVTYPDWQPLPAFILSDNALTIPFRDIILISGRFIYSGATMTSGRKLELWEQPADSYKDFAPVPGTETTTDKDGFFSFEKVQPQENTNYQVRFAGDPKAGLEAAMSPIKAVNVRVLISLVLSTDGLRLGKTLIMSGEVQPSHDGEVTLAIKRDGRKVATKHVGVDGDSRYSLTYEPRRSGSYSVVARYPGDDDHLGNASPKRSFRVVR